MQDIHDIRPPVPVGIDPVWIRWVLLGIGITILLALAIVLIRKWSRNRKIKKGLKLLPAPPLPYDAAQMALENLSADPVRDLQAFYFDLTMVLRRYMGASFGTRAVEMTSQEFIADIRKMKLEEPLKLSIIEFYKGCDIYKYAGSGARAEQVLPDIESVKSMIAQVEAVLKADGNVEEEDL